jgi:hypothetical protein
LRKYEASVSFLVGALSERHFHCNAPVFRKKMEERPVCSVYTLTAKNSEGIGYLRDVRVCQ